jgi:hypothetical protein
MRPGTLQCLVLMTSAMLMVGCRRSMPPDGNERASATTSSPSSLQQPLVFYGEAGTPSAYAPPLSEPEVKQIVDIISKRTTDSIWFILVRLSLHEGERNMSVYLVPSKETPRVREGHAYGIALFRQRLDSIGLPSEYMQISQPDQTFTGPPALPSASDLPFLRPKSVAPDSKDAAPISEEELVRIADFARQATSYAESSRHDTASVEAMRQNAQKMPIRSIGTRRGKIYVNFGFSHGGTFGHGAEVEIEYTPNGYIVVNWGEWIS